MAAHVVKWLQPSPLWREAGNDAGVLARPAILRFATDSFMDDFLALLERDPDGVAALRVRHETWREPMEGSKQLEAPIALERPPRRVLDYMRFRLQKARSPVLGPPPRPPKYQLKLYQPSQQRHYLVASSLVCALPGFPDRTLDPGRHERVSFVMRRLFPRTGAFTEDLPEMKLDQLSDWDEHAFVSTPSGPSWRKLERPGRGRAPGEEPLPMFPVAYQDMTSFRRRILAGTVPVAKREAYLGAPQEQVGADSSEAEAAQRASDPRRLLFVTQVIAPWKSLIGSSDIAKKKLEQGAPAGLDGGAQVEKDRARLAKDAREKLQVGSWYVLLDFADLLSKYLPAVFDALMAAGEPPEGQLSAAERAVFDALDALEFSGLKEKLLTGLVKNEDGTPGSLPYADADVTESLRDALARVVATKNDDTPTNRQKLEEVTGNYNRQAANAKVEWPDFLFVVADPMMSEPLLGVTDTGAHESRFRPLDELTELISLALPPPSAETPPAVGAHARPGIDPRDGWFVLRCVYEQPECGELHPATLSAPTEPFQLAGFFDVDAPARPIRIGLPIDPTPAGLRNFDKKTFMMVSDVLCGHIDRVRKIGFVDLVLSVLPWPFHKDLPEAEGKPCRAGASPLGMMCAFSLPIITLCALILLIIMVALFDLIFRWLPFLFVCFPIPGFAGKKKGVFP